MQSYDDLEAEPAEEHSDVQSLLQPHASPPVISSADVPLCLNIERSVHYGEPDLCLWGPNLCKSIGIVAVPNILEIVLQLSSNQLSLVSLPMFILVLRMTIALRLSCRFL